jgi:PAS domain S-box-containing protein
MAGQVADAATLRETEHRVSRVLAETTEIEAAYDAVLETIGGTLGWEFGAAWERDPGDYSVLLCVATWCAPALTGSAFAKASRSVRLHVDEGLPGRVVAAGEPVWLEDVPTEGNFPRSAAAVGAGLHAAVGFPLRAGNRVLGAMEFFARDLRQPDTALVASLAMLGSQIGQFAARRAAEREQLWNEARMRGVLEAALDCIITIDGAGRVLDFNAAAERTFGYAAADVNGRDIAELIVPPSLRALHRRGLARYLATQKPKLLDRRIELTAMRADGSEFPVELTVTRVRIAGPPAFTAYLRDITDRKAAEAELRASRARILAAADRERRRVERNLHDGAQQRLVSAALALRLAGTKLEDDVGGARERLAVAEHEIAEALEELRTLGRGLHPAVLSDRGLAPALEALALRAPLPVELDVDVEDRLPDAIEAAAYYLVSEALTNAAKHARAASAHVNLTRRDGSLRVAVSDDGVGGVDLRKGSGVTGLRDRIESLDGSLEVTSEAGRGTRLVATLPLHPRGQG